MEKYIKTMQLANELPGKKGPDELYVAVNGLFDDILSNYPDPVVNESDSSEIFNDNEIFEFLDMWRAPSDSLHETLSKIPPEYTDSIFPIAVIRMVLLGYKLNLNPSKINQMKKFDDRYGKIIQASMARESKNSNKYSRYL